MLCSMLEYNDVTSMVRKKVPSSLFKVFKVLIRSSKSFRQLGRALTVSCRQMSMQCDNWHVGLLMPDYWSTWWICQTFVHFWQMIEKRSTGVRYQKEGSFFFCNHIGSDSFFEGVLFLHCWKSVRIDYAVIVFIRQNFECFIRQVFFVILDDDATSLVSTADYFIWIFL